MRSLTFTAYGTPKGQGNHRRNRAGATYEATKGHGPWRRAVITAARAETQRWEQRRPLEAGVARTWEPHTVPVSIVVTFQFARPASHYGAGRNSGRLRPDAEPLPTSLRVGDIDKHVRTILDALTKADVIADDSLVVQLAAEKRWCVEGERPGAVITVREVT